MTASAAHTDGPAYRTASQYIDFGVDPAFDRDPYTSFAKLRGLGPVVVLTEALQSEFGFPDNLLYRSAGREVFLGLTYNACRTIASDAKNFSVATAYQDTLAKAFGEILITTDGPKHTQLKKLVLPSFAHRIVNEDLVSMAAPLIKKELDEIAPRGRGELIADFTSKFPFQIVAKIFGIPPHLHQEAEELATAGQRMGDDPAGAMAALAGMNAMYLKVVDDHRVNRADDLIGTLLDTEIDGVKLTDDEIVGFLKNIIAGGLDTTSRQVANLIYLLLENPDQFDDLKTNPELLEGAIQEGMRLVAAGGWTPRVALDDVEIEGVLIPKGSGVYPVIHSANRDPSRWENPDRFDIQRPRKMNMSFGAGAHACLGANLSMLEQKVAMKGVLAQLKNLRKDQLRWHDAEMRGINLRSPTQLPVLWD